MPPGQPPPRSCLRRFLDGDPLADDEVDQPDDVRDAEHEMEATIEDLVWLTGQVPALPALVVEGSVRPLVAPVTVLARGLRPRPHRRPAP